MLPINYESWHHIPNRNKNQALENIKRFALEVSDDYIKKALGKKWRDHKSTLKIEYFEKDISLIEKLRNVPPGMLRYQWKVRLDFGIQRKERYYVFPNSYIFFRSLVWLKSWTPSIFEVTYRKKDGSPMTSEAGEIMEKLQEKKVEYEAIASTDSSVNLENIDNKIITEVLGPERYGRVRFQGSGVTPTQYFGSSSQQYMPSRSQAQAKVRRLRDQIAQIKYEELQQKLRADAAAREAATAAREAEAVVMAAEQSKKYDEL
ncbi:hypothetical protein GOBAR_AA17288 [Gossypium barbadense]|uniref:Uncharacterized protein n=1 Tax=Gossypium barbadense TaxID=3634 RepID=A0A2P5XJ50_GOSBA|nr:hypothetical protein GOBAR_AA17288 [Gossypium barbadense]